MKPNKTSQTYLKLRHSRNKPEKISAKQGVDLYSRANIKTFTTEWSTNGALLPIDTQNLP